MSSHIVSYCFNYTKQQKKSFFSSFSRSSDRCSSLLDESGSASKVPQASVELVGYGSVVWPDSLSEWLADGAGLQMFCSQTASTARALLCMVDAEFGLQVIVEAVVACPV